LKTKIDEAHEPTLKSRRRKRFVPAGQSTQMIIGADKASDATILNTSAGLYSGYRLRRVYYSAFSPIPDASQALPLIRPPLMREHRLYQADWLYRFYGFNIDEITASQPDGMLELDIDPKLSWALANRARFPVDINSADKELLLRVPGLGVKTVLSILKARKHKKLGLEDLARLKVSVKKVKAFISASGWAPVSLIDRADLREMFT
ncbi:MAG: helix-hairpin-helix domain-containing protein, partial [Asticcacaulis sp.]